MGIHLNPMNSAQAQIPFFTLAEDELAQTYTEASNASIYPTNLQELIKHRQIKGQ